MKTEHTVFTISLALALTASHAMAQEAPDAALLPADAGLSAEASATADLGDRAGSAPPLVIGARLGGIFPPVFTELGSHVTVGLEVGYRLPVLAQRLEIMAGAGYAPPGRTYDDGPYAADVTQEELHFSLGPRARFALPGLPLQVTAAAGFRLFLLRSTSTGSRDMESFAEFTEQSTRAGFFGALGGEFGVGPGAAFLDIELGYSSLPHKITGDVSTGNLAAVVGYRLFLL
jgi:hypothetical protein